MNVPICRLCKNENANQTGSHIFSWFLIRDAINKLGNKRRDNEITFHISTEKFVKTYFGREITPDQIRRIKGEELSDDEINQMVNPFTKDNIICSKCEKRLSKLEEINNINFFQALNEYKVNSPNYDIHEFQEGELIRLFIYSLAWRASIVNQNDFQMDASHEEKLRTLLAKVLSIDETQLYQNISSNKNEINSYPLIITFSQTIGENTNFIFCSGNKRPYAMILNSLSFQLFFNPKHTKRINETLFGINQIISKNKLLNMNEPKIKIGILSNAQRSIINRKLGGYIAHKLLKRATDLFKEGFESIFQRPCPPGIVRFFVTNVALSRQDQVEKFTPEHFIQIATQVIHEYALMNALYVHDRFKI